MGNNSSKTKTGVRSLSNSSVNKNDVNITKTSSKIDKKKKKSRKWRIFSILKSKKPELERTKSQRRSKRKYNETKKPKIQEQKPLQAPTVLAPKPQIGHVKTIQDYEAFMINRIKEQLNRDGQAFVLNQLMLSMQFFGNYQRDLVHLIIHKRYKLKN
uniref:CSON007113 protein n=1 Tax=Culicoides sonorensis TaxID=179676 RepID=A0A336MUI4_CULSO